MDPTDGSNNIYIYFHIAAIGRYRQVVTEMYSILFQSGLLNRITELRYCVTGPEKHKDWVVTTLAHPRCRLYAYQEDTHTYERFTLDLLHRDAVNSEVKDYRVLYLHSKGVTKPESVYTRVWRKLMMHFLVTHYEHCLRMLQEPYHQQVVGILFRTIPQPHFSGNFWWTKRSYLQSLPPIRQPMIYYIDTELWIGLSLLRAVSLYQRPGHLQTEPNNVLAHVPVSAISSLTPANLVVVIPCTKLPRPRIGPHVRIFYGFGYESTNIKDHGLLFPLDPRQYVRVIHDHVPAVQTFLSTDFQRMYPELFFLRRRI